MKKLLFIAIAAITFCSCTDNQEEHKANTAVCVEDSTLYVSVRHYNYKNHSYIRFGRHYEGWVHDPDCDYCLSAFE